MFKFIKNLFGFGKTGDTIDLTDTLTIYKSLRLSPFSAFATVTILKRSEMSEKNRRTLINKVMDFQELCNKIKVNYSERKFYIKDLVLFNDNRDLRHKVIRVILINNKNYSRSVDHEINVHKVVTRANPIIISSDFMEEGRARVIDFYQTFDSLTIDKKYIDCNEIVLKYEEDSDKHAKNFFPPLAQEKTKQDLDKMAMDGGKYNKNDNSDEKRIEKEFEKLDTGRPVENLNGISVFAGVEPEPEDNSNCPEEPIMPIYKHKDS